MKFDWTRILMAGAGLPLIATLSLATLPAQKRVKFEKPVRIEADGKVIDTGKDIGYAGPLFFDYDGDQRPDLLVSSFRGNIRFFKNVGTRELPKFEEGQQLQAEGQPLRIHNW